MSPAPGMLAPPLIEIVPFDTRSPTTASVPPPVTDTALPGTPPHPAWSSAVIVGANRRLFTFALAADATRGVAPLVRMLANCSWSGLEALIVNCEPAGPSPATTCVRTVPSAYVQLMVRGGAPYSGAQLAGPAYRRMLASE